MDRSLIGLLDLVGWFFLLLYVIGPFLILFSTKMAAHPQFQSFNPEQLPPQVQPFFQRTLQAMLSQGFVVIDYLLSSGMTANTMPCLVYLVNPRTGDSANITCLWVVVDGAAKPRTQYAEYATRFANGHAITTNNSKTLGSFKPVEGRRSFYHADIVDIDQLYQLHRTAIEKYEAGQQKVLPPPGQEVPIFLQKLTESYDNQVKTGLLRYDARSDSYRPTLSGGFYMTYSLLFPLKQIRTARMRTACQEIKTEWARRASQPAV